MFSHRRDSLWQAKRLCEPKLRILLWRGPSRRQKLEPGQRLYKNAGLGWPVNRKWVISLPRFSRCSMRTGLIDFVL